MQKLAAALPEDCFNTLLARNAGLAVFKEVPLAVEAAISAVLATAMAAKPRQFERLVMCLPVCTLLSIYSLGTSRGCIDTHFKASSQQLFYIVQILYTKDATGLTGQTAPQLLA